MDVVSGRKTVFKMCQIVREIGSFREKQVGDSCSDWSQIRVIRKNLIKQKYSEKML